MVETYCAEETFALGKKTGELAKPGTVIALTGDLGVGKTVFTQGGRTRHRGTGQQPDLYDRTGL